MKRASSLVLALLMAAGMALAQTGGDKKSSTELNPQPLPPGKVKAESKAKKGHKGGKKSKKGASANTTTPPPK